MSQQPKPEPPKKPYQPPMLEHLEQWTVLTMMQSVPVGGPDLP
ncbi:MAG: hypothetical protein RLZZ156_2387 [Deinococcota bacterium]|jgi:hypothetical protein